MRYVTVDMGGVLLLMLLLLWWWKMGGEAWDEVVPLDMSHESQYYDCWNVYMCVCVCVYFMYQHNRPSLILLPVLSLVVSDRTL